MGYEKLEEMLKVLTDICKYNGEISMYEDMVLRDVIGVLNAIKEIGVITAEEVEHEH